MANTDKPAEKPAPMIDPPPPTEEQKVRKEVLEPADTPGRIAKLKLVVERSKTEADKGKRDTVIKTSKQLFRELYEGAERDLQYAEGKKDTAKIPLIQANKKALLELNGDINAELRKTGNMGLAGEVGEHVDAFKRADAKTQLWLGGGFIAGLTALISGGLVKSKNWFKHMLAALGITGAAIAIRRGIVYYGRKPEQAPAPSDAKPAEVPKSKPLDKNPPSPKPLRSDDPPTREIQPPVLF